MYRHHGLYSSLAWSQICQDRRDKMWDQAKKREEREIAEKERREKERNSRAPEVKIRLRQTAVCRS